MKKTTNENLGAVKNTALIKENKGITLVALVVTLVILLILARYNNSNPIWRKWNNKGGAKSQKRYRKSARRY